MFIKINRKERQNDNNMDITGGKEKGLYNKQEQIINNNKQQVSKLIRPLHYKLQSSINKLN